MTLYWPHEASFDTDGHEAELIKEFGHSFAATMSVQSARFLPRRWRYRLLDWYSADRFSQLNGGRPRLEGKHAFTQLVRSLDYQAPDSVLIAPHTKRAALAALVEQVRDLDLSSGKRLCKPIHASQGSGLHVAQSPEEAVRFASSSHELYTICTFEPPTLGELRYILHLRPEDIRAKRGPSVRIAACKLGPSIVGDGTHTVRELIALERRWSITDRRKLLIAAGIDIPTDGETVQLINSGNISRHLHRFTAPEPDLLVRMDAFMLQFLAALEAVTGVYGTVCVDIGLTENGPMFYEFQIPFGAPYGKVHGVFPEKRSALLAFLHSTILSGSMM
jgi:hypothetical protein